MDGKRLTLIAGEQVHGRGEPTISPRMRNCTIEEWCDTISFMNEALQLAEMEFWLKMHLRHNCLFVFDCTMDPTNKYHRK